MQQRTFLRVQDADARFVPLPRLDQPGRRHISQGEFLPQPPDQIPLGLPQRRLPGALAGVLPSARQGHLSGVAAQGVRAAGQQDAVTGLALHQTDQHGGPKANRQSRANYGYLDGHAETNTFDEVFKSQQQNRFNPFAGPS